MSSVVFCVELSRELKKSGKLGRVEERRRKKISIEILFGNYPLGV
jgi:hypothetical protein